jgi:glucosamine--fructose-6-phosphate aminotransferase (isomerizing)
MNGAATAAFYVLAEAVARARGLDPDHPRNLQKVTRTM